jgi:hypothetical protein
MTISLLWLKAAVFLLPFGGVQVQVCQAFTVGIIRILPTPTRTRTRSTTSPSLHMGTPTNTNTPSSCKNITTNNRQTSKRWNGNYKHASKKLCDMSKAKKLRFPLTANGVTKTVEKKREESLQHVLTKAIIWKLYMQEYPNLEIEYDIGDPDYLPDVVSVPVEFDDEDANGASSSSSRTLSPILFWGESGRMKVHKAVDLLQRYPEAHIVHCRWGMEIDTFAAPLLEYLQDQYDAGTLDSSLSSRPGKFTFCSLPLDVWRFIDEETRTITVTKDDLEWKELEFPSHETSSPLSD